jgi:hypothetical protein
MSKIKVALCLTGDVRNDMASFSYIYESFLSERGKYYDIDIYMSSWNNMFRSFKLYKPKNFIFEYNNYNLFKKFLHNLKPQTKSIISKLYPELHLTSSIHPLRNTFLMSLANKNCFNIIKEKYDYYIKCRFDTFFEKPINLNNLFHLINNTDFDSIIPTIGGPTLTTQYNDQLFISNYKGFKIYCDFINHIEQIICKSNNISPEILLTHYLKDNVNVCTWNFYHHIIRNDNLILE